MMYQVPQVTDSVYYVGVNDRSKSLFENMWPLPYGVSYNSYLVVDEKVALIDTVDVCYSEIFFKKLDTVLKGRPIDYLIVDHMEPDHSGSIGLLRQRYPNMQIVGNKKTHGMLEGYHHITEGLLEVKEGDKLSLGKNELTFIFAPMVHWPEVMFTNMPTQQVLFSADAFGTFGTLDGHIFDKDMDLSFRWEEMYRYYACIVGKYGSFVQKVLTKFKEANLPVQYICSTHGPVWTPAHFSEAFDLYDRMSRYEAEEGAVILYGTMYGNTEVLADTIAQGIAAGGIRNVVCHNVAFSPASNILRDIFKYKAVIIGSPTYSNEIFSPIKNIMEMIRLREVKDRYLSVFGSFTWAGQAVKKIVPFAEEMGWEMVGEPLEQKMSTTDELYEKGWVLGNKIAERLKADRQ